MTPDEAAALLARTFTGPRDAINLAPHEVATRLLLAERGEARTALAQRDATIAAQQPVVDAAEAWVEHMGTSRDVCTGVAAGVITAIDAYRAALGPATPQENSHG